MVSRKLEQRNNAWLIRVKFFNTYSLVNGLCFGYFQIFPERSPFDLKITLTPFPYVRRLLDLTVFPKARLTLALYHLLVTCRSKLEKTFSEPQTGNLKLECMHILQ